MRVVVSEEKKSLGDLIGSIVQLACAAQSFLLNKAKKKEVIFISLDVVTHDEILEDQYRKFEENGYYLNKQGEVSGNFDEIEKEVSFFNLGKFESGEVDILGKDYDEDVCVLCEIKPYDGASHIKKSYDQLARGKKHYKGKFPGVEIRTCMRLGDVFQEVVAQDKSDLRKNVIEEFEDEGIYEDISEKKRFYRSPGEQSGIVSVFAKSELEKEISMCNIVAPVKDNLCQSAIDRLKNRKEELLSRRKYENFDINTYVKPLGLEMINVDKVDGNGSDMEYSVIEEVVGKVPRHLRWAKVRDNT